MFNSTSLGVSVATNTEINNIHNERPVGNSVGFIRIKDKIYDKSNIDKIEFEDGKKPYGRYYDENKCFSWMDSCIKEKIHVYTKDGKKEIIEFDAEITRMGEKDCRIKDFVFGKGREAFEKAMNDLI